jgi:hypothetical protein
MVTSADTRLGELIENTPGSVVAGERLNSELLRRFYARHGFAPVWTNRQGQAESLMNAVSRAGDHGLAPELFHADVLRSPATVPALDRELLLSNAFLSYADALARGVVPAERRVDQQDHPALRLQIGDPADQPHLLLRQFRRGRLSTYSRTTRQPWRSKPS